MSAWIDTLGELFAAHTACVMVTVTESGGSTPREAGTKMIVTGDAIFGTIGGGHLELAAIGTARTVLAATTNRQAAVRAVAERADMVLVVGSSNSSNTVRLREVAAGAGVPAYRVDGLDEIDPGWYAGAGVVGLTAGASVPDELLEPIIADLRARGVTKVEPVIVAEETVEFQPPQGLEPRAG